MDWRQRVYCVETEDGGVVIYTPNPEYEDDKEEWLKVNSLVNIHRMIDLNPIQLPSTRKYRAAWKISGNRISLDYQKAKKLYKLRKEQKQGTK